MGVIQESWACSSTSLNQTDAIFGRLHNHVLDETWIIYTKCWNVIVSIERPAQFFPKAMSDVAPKIQTFLFIKENMKHSLRNQITGPS